MKDADVESADPDEAEQLAMRLDDECVELDKRDRAVLNLERASAILREELGAVVAAAARRERERCTQALRERVELFRDDLRNHDEGSFGWKHTATCLNQNEICLETIAELPDPEPAK